MLWRQAAQNTGLSNRKLKSALKCTVWSQCTPIPDRQTDEHHGNSATIGSDEPSRAKNPGRGLRACSHRRQDSFVSFRPSFDESQPTFDESCLVPVGGVSTVGDATKQSGLQLCSHRRRGLDKTVLSRPRRRCDRVNKPQCVVSLLIFADLQCSTYELSYTKIRSFVIVTHFEISDSFLVR